MMFIGQEKLKNKLNSITLDNMPRSLLLLGESGCGKHSYCNLIANKLSLPVIDITENISLDTINDIYSKVNPNLYILDSSKITIKEQNMLLKFIEEPLKNSYLIILCKSKNSLLPTILNRCQIWIFEEYSKEELQYFNIEDSYGIANTPGQLLKLQGVNVASIVQLADNILEKMKNASLANALSISNKIAFKDEKDKFPLDIFNKILLKRSVYKLKNTPVFETAKMYKLISEYFNNIDVPRVDSKILLDNLIVNLWEVAHQ